VSDDRLFAAMADRNPWWGAEWRDTSVPRDALEGLKTWLERPDEAPVLAVCGMRRCGKSTLLGQVVAWLLEGHVAGSGVLWLDLEDAIFHEVGRSGATLDRCFDLYAERLKPEARPVLVLDEVQNVPGWPAWVRTVHETGRALVLLSGSSSKLLEPDLHGSILTGRTVTIRLWPLSFREYLRFRGLEPPPGDLRLADADALRQDLHDYLRRGGVPMVARDDDSERRGQRLREVFDGIVLRDVAGRHEVRRLDKLRHVAHEYLLSTGAKVSFKRVKNRFKLANDQAHQYAGFLEEAYLIRLLREYSDKHAERAMSEPKAYAVDTGIREAATFSPSPDWGRLLETAVYVELCRRGHAADTWYWSRDGECDFVVVGRERPRAACQVCFAEHEPIPDREEPGLLSALDGLDIEEGLLLTEGVERPPRRVGRHVVRTVPAYRWLLEP